MKLKLHGVLQVQSIQGLDSKNLWLLYIRPLNLFLLPLLPVQSSINKEVTQTRGNKIIYYYKLLVSIYHFH